MGLLTPSIRPMHYVGSRTVSWTVDPSVVEIASSINGIPPAISTYIAYDTLSPPNPFLAVTQDGAGNVVYDGGFPKFYNSAAPASNVTSFSQLNASFKFLFNAINFIANKQKVTQGNRKVLVFGDAALGSNYDVKGTRNSDFRISFERLFSIMEFTVTIKNREDWGGIIDISLNEMEEYCAIIIMSSEFVPTDNTKITQATISNLTSYRANGNGLMIITDHGPVINDISQANNFSGGAFFAMANRIAVNFGAFFTGDYDRSPVNVGFIRSTYGDHPLYDGMGDHENIFAGGSESEVRVTQITTYTPNNIPDTHLTDPGRYTLNFLLIKSDGSATTERYTYSIIEGEFVFFRNPTNNALVSSQYVTPRRNLDLLIALTDPDLGTLTGEVLRNGVVVGEFQHDITDGTTYRWFAGTNRPPPINEGDVIALEVKRPFGYYTEVTIVKTTVGLPSGINLAHFLKALADAELTQVFPTRRLASQRQYARATYLGTDFTIPHYGREVQGLQRHLSENDPLYPTITFDVFPTLAIMNSELGNLSSNVTTVINAQHNEVLIKNQGVWTKVPNLTPYHVLGRRRLIANYNGDHYMVSLAGVTRI